jgi:hypothetical protein
MHNNIFHTIYYDYDYDYDFECVLFWNISMIQYHQGCYALIIFFLLQGNLRNLNVS